MENAGKFNAAAQRRSGAAVQRRSGAAVNSGVVCKGSWTPHTPTGGTRRGDNPQYLSNKPCFPQRVWGLSS